MIACKKYLCCIKIETSGLYFKKLYNIRIHIYKYCLTDFYKYVLFNWQKIYHWNKITENNTHQKHLNSNFCIQDATRHKETTNKMLGSDDHCNQL